MVGKVAGLKVLPYVGLMVRPSWFWLASLPNILETTGTCDDIDNIKSRAGNRCWDQESSVGGVGGGDKESEVGLSTQLAGAPRSPVETSG